MQGEWSPFAWRRWALRLSGVLLLATCALVGIKALERCRFLWNQQQCLLYQADRNIAVFDSRPSALAVLRRSGGGWTNNAYTVVSNYGPPVSIPYVIYTALEFRRLNPFSMACGSIFMHLRMSPSGNQRLVMVWAEPGLGLRYYVVTPSTFLSDPPLSKKGAAMVRDVAGMPSIVKTGVAIFGGQVDVDHPDHFVIPYRISNNALAIDCWLQDDDSIRMVDSGLTPTPQPSPVLSR